MKKLMFLLLLAVLVVSGCGKDSTSKKDNSDSKTAEAASKGQDKTTDSKEQKGLKLVKQIDQLGMEPIPLTDSSNSDPSTFHIFEKDGYTYVVNVESSFGSNADTLPVDVSVLKDNKWVVKNKVTDLYNQVWNNKNDNAQHGAGYPKFIGSAMYLETNDLYGDNNDQHQNKIVKITFEVDGTPHSMNILDKLETTDDSIEYGMLDNFDQSYIYENISNTDNNLDKYNILGEDGKVVTSFTNSSSSNSDSKVQLSDRDESISIFNNGFLYFGNIKGVQAYNINKKDLIWNADGSKLKFPLASGFNKSYSLVKNGIYSVTNLQKDYYLGYAQFNIDGSAREMDSIQIPSSLNILNAFVSEDSKNVNVYTVVDYKGKLTIQKYIYSRIDQNNN